MTIIMRSIDQLGNLFSDFLSSIAPSLYEIVDFHCKKQVGMSFAEASLKNPKLTYEFLVKFFDSEIAVDVLDLLLSNYLKKYNIQAYGILKNFKNGDNTKLIEVAELYSKVIQNGGGKNRN